MLEWNRASGTVSTRVNEVVRNPNERQWTGNTSANEFVRAHPDWERIKVPFPARLLGKAIKEVRIIPIERTRFFTI